MVNKNVKALTAALRSGEYKQTIGRLRENGCYCVAGVAADVWAKAHGEVWYQDTLEYDCVAGASISMPDAAAEWYGFGSLRGEYVTAEGEERSLIQDNDDQMLTFDQLADIIESEPAGLFAEPEPVQLLIDALRGGDYTQGCGALRNHGCHCVMGVAADIWHKTTGEGEWTPSFYDRIEGTSTCLPEAARDWFGFRTVFGDYGPRDEDGYSRDSLICDNDGGKTFAQLADIIESKPEGLFV